jgi:hypothetical protein
MLISALDVGAPRVDVREQPRNAYRVAARFRLFGDEEAGVDDTLYTRDVDPRGVGFVTRRRLPLGYGGRLEIVTAAGEAMTIPATILRCRECAPGWYEGALAFNRPQHVFRVHAPA